MKIDKNEFIQQATLRICGNLDISQAMLDFIDYAKDYIPVAEIAFTRSHHDFSFIRRIVSIASSGETMGHAQFSPPAQTRALLIKKYERWQQTGRIIARENNPESNPLAASYLSFFKTKDPSAIFMLLTKPGGPIDNISIIAEGSGTLTKVHEYIIALLHEPFSIALANAMRYQKVLELKQTAEIKTRELDSKLQNLSAPQASEAPKVFQAKKGIGPLPHETRFLSLDDANTRLILDALGQTHGKIHGKDGAAALLQINPETLRSRMRKLGIKAKKTWEAQ